MLNLKKMKASGDKITMLTVYDATFSSLYKGLGVDVLLIGDSLGQVVQGHNSTIPVTIEDMVYHTRCVHRGASDAFILSDMPFMTYPNVDVALHNAAKLIQAGASMVKLEGGLCLVPILEALTQQGIPVCAHLGLTPQSVLTMGGYKVQGRDKTQAIQILEDAVALEAAGAGMIVLECIPRLLAKEISLALSIPVIGIGAGPDCDGQVLVLHDMLGITPGKNFTFTKNFMTESDNGIEGAISAYVNAVKNNQFPADEHCFQ